MQRTILTARHIAHVDPAGGAPAVQLPPRIYRAIDEIFVGDAEGLSEAQFKERYPSESDLRKRDKIGYRYPRGESYYDIIARLEPVMIELLSLEAPLLVVSHQATLRMVRGFLLGLKREDCPAYEIPLHTVMKITYDGWNPPSEERFILGPDPLEALDGEVTDERTKRGPCSPRDGQKHL